MPAATALLFSPYCVKPVAVTVMTLLSVEGVMLQMLSVPYTVHQLGITVLEDTASVKYSTI